MQAEYMGRTSKCYPIHESEIESLATFDALGTVFSAIGSAALAFAGGIWTNAAFAEKLTPLAELTSKFGAPLLCTLSLIFYLLAYFAVTRRRSLWKRIKGEAVTLHAHAALADQTFPPPTSHNHF